MPSPMKKLIALCVVALLALVAYGAAGPFLTVRSISQAVERGDMKSLQRDVDFPLVRGSLKAQIEDYLARTMSDRRTSSRLRDLGRQVTASMTGGVVDALATPAGIGAILQGRSVIRRAMGYPPNTGPAVRPPAPSTRCRALCTTTSPLRGSPPPCRTRTACPSNSCSPATGCAGASPTCACRSTG